MVSQKLLAVSILWLCCSCGLYAQNTVLRQEFIMAGERTLESSHASTLDGGTIMVSWMRDSSTFDEHLVFVKLDTNGTMQWHLRIGPVYYGCRNIQQTIDSGFVVCYRQPFGTQLKIKVLKLDKNGNPVYVRIIDPPIGYSVFKDPQIIARRDGNLNVCFVVFDSVTSTLQRTITTLDNFGTLIWTRTFFPAEDKTHYNDADTCSNGDIVLVGTYLDPNTMLQCPLLSRISPTGTLLWTKYYSAAPRIFSTSSVKVMQGDFIMISASSYNPNTMFSEHVVIRTDGAGNEIWTNLYSSPGLVLTQATIDAAENHNVLLCGNSGSYHATIKLDSAGNIIYSREYPGIYFHSTDTTSNGMYSFASMNCFTYTMMFITTNSQGVGCGENNTPLARIPLVVQSFQTGSDTTLPFIITSTAVVHQNKPITPIVICSSVGFEENVSRFDTDIYPVPASEIFSVYSTHEIIQLTLFDSRGRPTLHQTAHSNLCQVDISSLTPGLYLLTLEFETHIESHRLVIE